MQTFRRSGAVPTSSISLRKSSSDREVSPEHRHVLAGHTSGIPFAYQPTALSPDSPPPSSSWVPFLGSRGSSLPLVS